jgi:hypothetical protein
MTSSVSTTAAASPTMAEPWQWARSIDKSASAEATLARGEAMVRAKLERARDQRQSGS